MVELNEKAEEVVFCPQCGWNSAMDVPALPDPDDGLVEMLKGVLKDYDDDLARTIAAGVLPDRFAYGEDVSGVTYADLREAATALQSKDEQIERLTRIIEVMGKVRDEKSLAIETAEQQVQKLTAENERLRKALEPLGALAAAVFRTVDGVEMNAQKADDAVVWSFDWVDLTYGHLRAARSALEAQEDGK